MEYIIGAFAFWLFSMEIRMWMHRKGIQTLGEVIIELAESLEYEPSDEKDEVH